MAQGRKRMPDSVKKTKGTLRSGRVNPDAPIPVDETPEPPAWLSTRERAHFRTLTRRLEQIGVASSTDTEAVAIAAQRMEEVIVATAIIEREGPVIDSVNVRGERMLRSNPAVGQRSDALRHLQSLLSEFGLTPAARSKVTAKVKKKKDGRFQPRS